MQVRHAARVRHCNWRASCLAPKPREVYCILFQLRLQWRRERRRRRRRRRTGRFWTTKSGALSPCGAGVQSHRRSFISTTSSADSDETSTTTSSWSVLDDTTDDNSILGGPSTVSKNYSCCSVLVFTTIPDTQKSKTERKDHTVSVGPLLSSSRWRSANSMEAGKSKYGLRNRTMFSETCAV